MRYSGISSRERNLLEEISRRNLLIFSPVDASNILNETRDNAYKILNRMVNKNLLVRIEKGKYISRTDLEESHIYEIACHIAEPSYVSLWSALHYYGYTTQISRRVYVILTMPKDSLIIGGEKIKFVKTKKHNFFGYKKDGGILIAEPEKLFIDCLLYPEYSGGMGEITDALIKAKINGGKLVDYVVRVGNKSLCSRLGFLLEKTHKSFDSEHLKRFISESYVPLDPSSIKTGDNVREWMIINNLR